MKVNRTFSIHYDLVTKLQIQRNQSATVCRALDKWFKEKEKFDLSDIPTRRMMWALSRREDCPSALKAIIEDIMVD